MAPSRPLYKICSDPSFYTLLIPHLVGHPSEHGMYDNMIQGHYWPFMANKVYTIVSECHECVINRAELKWKRHLKLLSASGSLEFVALGIVGLLPKTTTRNQFIIVIAYG